MFVKNGCANRMGFCFLAFGLAFGFDLPDEEEERLATIGSFPYYRAAEARETESIAMLRVVWMEESTSFTGEIGTFGLPGHRVVGQRMTDS